MAFDNLYPPIMQSAMPSFVRTQPCRVYFSLSMYNTATDIKNVQVSVTNQTTNKSALKNSLYPSGIKITNLIFDDTIQNNYKYYVVINPADLEQEEFEINQFYVVQLRFTSKNAPNPPSSGTGLATWLANNINYFSEWSTTCLIKGIEQPYIEINDLNSQASTTFFVFPTAFVGRMTYQQNADIEKEVLKSYNVHLYETATNNTVVKSDQIYTNPFNPNEFNYELLYDLQKQVNYTLALTYSTNNLYTQTVNFEFIIDIAANNQLNVELSAIPEEENGRIKIDIDFESSVMNPSRNLIIKRTSSRSNFHLWETVKEIFHNQQIRHIWYDTSIESGIWYKYRVQQNNDVGKIKDIEKPVICTFEDVFLTYGEKQLKIQFNPTVGDLKYNVMESQQTTLGARYPYVKRNGNNFFRSFSISGLITAFMDDTNWYDPNFHDGDFFYKNTMQKFTTANELYGDAATALYKDYNFENNISNYQDYIYEREFRQKVIDFLYENNIKLFRSLTEGNMLVKLINISLQPVNELGRMLYSFSATALEIDDNIINNYIKYHIINKFYYTYFTHIISGSFQSGESFIERLKNVTTIPSDIDVMRLRINAPYEKDLIVYAKILNNDKLLEYELKNQFLQLNYSDTDPIAESYFFGIRLHQDDFTITNQYYDSTSAISSPITNGVYYIAETGTLKIDNYISFNDTGLLTTYENEVLKNQQLDYALLGEQYYNRCIYYNGQWYLFSDNNDVLINSITATIEYYYRIKKED